MKKVISLIVCLAIAVLAQNEQYQYYPQQQTANMEQRAKIQRLINNGIAKNKEEILKEASSLSALDKEALYEKNKLKAAAGWAALDFFPGFGLGSYIQGDITFGSTQSALDFVGWAVLVCGFVAYESIYPDDEENNKEAKKDAEDVLKNSSLTSMIILGASRIMSWIFPFIYQKGYNKSLDEALNGSINISYSIDPLIVPKDGMPAVGLAFNLRY